MKQCPYCGKEYSDDADVCLIDGQALEAEASGQRTEDPDSAHQSLARVSQPFQPWPDYRWTQRDAWKFIGMIVVFDVVWFYALSVPYTFIPHFYHWRWGPFGDVTMAILYAGLHFFTALYFARTETFASFWKAAGLDRKPTNYAWFGVTAAVGIRLFGHVIYHFGWAKTYPFYDFTAFRYGHGPERYLFLFPTLFAAFWEEPVNRGFLYKAFRGSYSAPVSTALIIGYTAYTHWYQYRHFGLAVVVLSALTVVQCALREKSDSLWDIILCHLAFNASNLIV